MALYNNRPTHLSHCSQIGGWWTEGLGDCRTGGLGDWGLETGELGDWGTEGLGD